MNACEITRKLYTYVPHTLSAVYTACVVIHMYKNAGDDKKLTSINAVAGIKKFCMLRGQRNKRFKRQKKRNYAHREEA